MYIYIYVLQWRHRVCGDMYIYRTVCGDMYICSTVKILETCIYTHDCGDVHRYTSVEIQSVCRHVDRKKLPPQGGFPIYYVPSSRTVCKWTHLEEFVLGASRGVLLHLVLD